MSCSATVPPPLHHSIGDSDSDSDNTCGGKSDNLCPLVIELKFELKSKPQEIAR